MSKDELLGQLKALAEYGDAERDDIAQAYDDVERWHA